MKGLGALIGLALLSAPAAHAAVAPGFAGGQELFRQNHWEEARQHLRSQWAQVAEKDRPAATFLIGRSYVREAELYRALRRFGDEVGLEYLAELGAAKSSRDVAWIPLFKGLYEVDAGLDAQAERTLLTPRPTLAAAWKATARRRRALALSRLGRGAEAATAPKDPSAEGRFLALLANGTASPPDTLPKEGRREKLLTAAVLFRAGRASEAESLLTGVNLDTPDVEDNSDPNRVLRFHDPLLALAWERIAWERAVVALRPLASGGAGTEKTLAVQYLGLSLLALGATTDAAAVLKDPLDASAGPDLQARGRVLLAASSWKSRAPTPAELLSLWDSTQAQSEGVLAWDELRRKDLAKTEPFASKLDTRIRGLLTPGADKPSGAMVGRVGLCRLRLGDPAAELLATLSEYRDKSNKNKLEWNDPLLLLALSVANYRDHEYAQALETLFEVSKTLPGLRAIQWNLQGIYAARQKAGGEARISQ